MASKMSSKIYEPHFINLYVGQKRRDEQRCMEVELRYGFRYIDSESWARAKEIVPREKADEFLEDKLVDALSFFDDVMGIYWMDRFVLHNGVPFSVGDTVERLPLYMEKFIIRQLEPHKLIEVYRVTVWGCNVVQ